MGAKHNYIEEADSRRNDHGLMFVRINVKGIIAKPGKSADLGVLGRTR